jgi:hypothetical protein
MGQEGSGGWLIAAVAGYRRSPSRGGVVGYRAVVRQCRVAGF